MIAYLKFRAGFYNVLCCICRPNKVPNCSEFNLMTGIDLSCAKYTVIGKPSSSSCEGDAEWDAGLCYKKCDKGIRDYTLLVLCVGRILLKDG